MGRRFPPVEEWYWMWGIVGKTQTFLERHRLKPCSYCKSITDGCDCGACDVIYPGSYGYWHCMSTMGCPVCGRPEKSWKKYKVGYIASGERWEMNRIRSEERIKERLAQDRKDREQRDAVKEDTP